MLFVLVDNLTCSPDSTRPTRTKCSGHTECMSWESGEDAGQMCSKMMFTTCEHKYEDGLNVQPSCVPVLSMNFICTSKVDVLVKSMHFHV